MEPLTIEPVYRFFCPVCGIELERSNYDTPERDYFCPFCSTQSMPSAVANDRDVTRRLAVTRT